VTPKRSAILRAFRTRRRTVLARTAGTLAAVGATARAFAGPTRTTRAATRRLDRVEHLDLFGGEDPEQLLLRFLLQGLQLLLLLPRQLQLLASERRQHRPVLEARRAIARTPRALTRTAGPLGPTPRSLARTARAGGLTLANGTGTGPFPRT